LHVPGNQLSNYEPWFSVVGRAGSGLRKAIGDKIVLDGIDLDVGSGAVFSLLARSGLS